jgi:hypothetical protein
MLRSSSYRAVNTMSQLMLCRGMIAVCSQIHTKHVNTLCGQNVEFLNPTPCGTYCMYLHALEGGITQIYVPCGGFRSITPFYTTRPSHCPPPTPPDLNFTNVCIPQYLKPPHFPSYTHFSLQTVFLPPCCQHATQRATSTYRNTMYDRSAILRS